MPPAHNARVVEQQDKDKGNIWDIDIGAVHHPSPALFRSLPPPARPCQELPEKHGPPPVPNLPSANEYE